MTHAEAVAYLIELGLVQVESKEAVKPGCFFVTSPTEIQVWFSGGHKIRATLVYDEILGNDRHPAGMGTEPMVSRQ